MTYSSKMTLHFFEGQIYLERLLDPLRYSYEYLLNKTKLFSLFCPVALFKNDFSRFRVEKLLMGVAVETGNEANTFNKKYICTWKQIRITTS